MKVMDPAQAEAAAIDDIAPINAMLAFAGSLVVGAILWAIAFAIVLT